MYKQPIKERFRFWLIFNLEDVARACWMDLVGWAVGDESYSELWRILKSHPQSCIDDAASSMGICYCGKYSNEHNPGWGDIVLKQTEEANAVQS